MLKYVTDRYRSLSIIVWSDEKTDKISLKSWFLLGLQPRPLPSLSSPQITEVATFWVQLVGGLSKAGGKWEDRKREIKILGVCCYEIWWEYYEFYFTCSTCFISISISECFIFECKVLAFERRGIWAPYTSFPKKPKFFFYI